MWYIEYASNGKTEMVNTFDEWAALLDFYADFLHYEIETICGHALVDDRADLDFAYQIENMLSID